MRYTNWGLEMALCVQSIIESHKQMEYTLLEKSKQFHKYLKERFQHVPRVECINFTEESKLKSNNSPVTIIMCEVLDNLAHDLIRVESDGSISEGYVVTNENARYDDIPGKFYFEFNPLEDPLILSTLNFISDHKSFKANPIEAVFKKDI